MTPSLNLPLPPFLSVTDDEIRVTGTRLGLYHLLEDYLAGDSAETLASQYRTLSLADAHKVIAFYLENRVEVDRFLAEYKSSIEKLREEGRKVDLDELRRRLAEKRAAEQKAAG